MTLKHSKIYLALVAAFAVTVTACSTEETNQDESVNIDYSGQIKISEVLTKDDNGGNDWIEIQVTGDEAIDLTGFTLADSNNEPAALPEVILAAGEYLVVQAADEAPNDGSVYVPFKLGDDDSVTLAYKGNPVDSMVWEDADVKSGRSYGEYKSELQRLYPTPNEDNIPYNAFITDEVVQVKIDISEQDWHSMLADPTAEEYHPATMTYNGITVENIAFRTKGNSSLSNVAQDPNSIRYSFKADFNYYEDGQKFLGLKKLNFNNIYSDPSMMREYLSYQLLDEMGVPSPRIAYVDLYVGGEHMGLYNVVEAIDSEFVERHFEYEDGDLYKAVEPSTLEFTGYATDNYSGLELKTNEDTSQKDALVSFIDSLNHDADPALKLNIDLYLRYLAVNTYLMNLDSYQGPFAHNYYLYQDKNDQGDLLTLLPWDYNMSMSAFPGGCRYEQATTLMIDEPVVSNLAQRPLVSRILAIEEYKQQYHELLSKLVNEVAATEKMSATIEAIEALISPYVAADPTKFYDYDTWQVAIESSIENEALMMGAPPEGMPPSGDFPEGMPPEGSAPDGSMPDGTPPSGAFPGGVPPEGEMPMSGALYTIGLKEFLHMRLENVAQQLSGDLPTASQNGTGGCPQ